MLYGICLNSSALAEGYEAGYDFAELAVAGLKPLDGEEEFTPIRDDVAGLAAADPGLQLLSARHAKGCRTGGRFRRRYAPTWKLRCAAHRK